MDTLKIAQTRYTSKAYDATKKIPTDTLNTLLEVLRLSPSSINIQPWQFLVVQSDQAKQKIAQAMPGRYAYNIPKILNASEVIVFTAKTDINVEHLDAILQAEDLAGRFRTPESKAAQRDTRLNYIELYKEKNIHGWVDNQIHIALGSALFAAQTLHIDATPIGGFDLDVLDQQLQLSSQGLRSVVLLALGYRSDEDFNADLPKARLAPNQIIQTL